MRETEVNNDLSDDADYAASIQQQHQQQELLKCSSWTDSDKGSVNSEENRFELVYCKDNIAIHPTQYIFQRISGRLQLVKQGSCLFMSWIPYNDNSNEKLNENDRNLYTIRDVPLTDIRSIRRHTPTLGWQYIIVVLSSGLAFPPLYFYSGGVREFLATLKQHIFLKRSADDASVFLVNDFRDPLQRSLSSLELPGVVSVADGSSLSIASLPLNENSEKIGSSYHGTSSTSEYREKHRKKGHDPTRDLSLQVLEKFSLVTKFARKTTSQIFHEVNNDRVVAGQKKSQSQSLQVNNVHEASSSDKQKVGDEIYTTSGSEEFDKLSLVWGKPRQPPLRYEEFASFLDAEGRIKDLEAFKKRIFYGGVEHKLRKEVWKFLLGYHQHDSTYAERKHMYSLKKSEYETIKSQWQNISPSQAKRFTKFRERKSLIEKDVVRTDRSVPFYKVDDSTSLTLLRDILLTYSFYNFDLGYCQGMSDLLSPILYVMADESDSFWCFVELMERLGPNFDRDQNGMHSQLFALLKLVELLDSPLHNYFKQNDCLNYFFCFRWILIQFKREFEYETMMRLWEVLWTHYLSEHLHLYVCVAILKRHRRKIMDEHMDFDTLLKFINELSGHIDVNATLRDAEALCLCAGENGAACIPPGTPPSLPIETVDMELQLGLALPCTPITGFDYLNNQQQAYEPIDSWSKKRAFDDMFHDTRPLKETLRLVSWDNHPNDEDDRGNQDRKNSSYSMNQDDQECNDVTGWPPISSWRKKHHHHHQTFQGARVNDNRRVQNNNGNGPQSMYVKVKMEGVPIGRKVDIGCHHSYQTLTATLTGMFEKYEKQHVKGSTYDDGNGSGSKHYMLTYQDRDGDWLLVGDVPYQSFIESVQRLSIKRTNGN